MVFFFQKIFKEFDDKDIKLYCSRLEDALKYGKQSDIDANELYLQLNLIDEFVCSETTNPTYVSKYMKKVSCFPNAINVNKVMITILASIETNFLILNLLKSYLQPTML